MSQQFAMINNFLIDVSIKEGHTFESDVTDFPTESGTSFSDNIRPKPIRITMEGLVSDSPIGEMTGNRPQTAPVTTPRAADESQHVISQVAYTAMLDVWNKREPVTIRTSLGTFERMALMSLEVPREAKNATALYFTAIFQQIQIVTNERVRVRAATPMGRGGKEKRGPQAAVDNGRRRLLWRKGAYLLNQAPFGGTGERIVPTGGGPYIYAQEIVVAFKAKPSDSQVTIFHQLKDDKGNETFTPLTNGELQTFNLDMDRDQKNEKALFDATSNAINEAYKAKHNMNRNPHEVTRRPITNMSRENRKAKLEKYNSLNVVKNTVPNPFRGLP